LLLTGWGRVPEPQRGMAGPLGTEGYGWRGWPSGRLGAKLAWGAAVVPSATLHGWPSGRRPAPRGYATGRLPGVQDLLRAYELLLVTAIAMLGFPNYYFWAILGLIMLFGFFYFRAARIKPDTFR
jgi:hypothetical protein